MSDRLLVRNVPAEVHQWIKQQRQQQQMSQQEFLLSLLHRASAAQLGPMLPFESSTIEVPVPDTLPFTFVDLFAGIGGFRIALKELGGKCAYSCEWDKYSQKTYKAWFDETPHGDIRQVKPKDIPDHDVLAAGFPCQPFSIAGVSKKKSLGRAHGFKCEMQGTLFFNIVSIVEVKRPPVLFLENVKNLQSHDQGRTWSTIYNALVDLGYAVNFKVIDASGWVPQHRERIYIVCFDKKVFGENPPFEFPSSPQGPKFKDILERTPDKKYTLTDHLWTYLQEYAERHRLKGKRQGWQRLSNSSLAPSLRPAACSVSATAHSAALVMRIGSTLRTQRYSRRRFLTARESKSRSRSLMLTKHRHRTTSLPTLG